MNELYKAANKDKEENITVLKEIRDELKSINKRQARSDRKTGLLTIVIAAITVYVSIATGYIEKEVAQEHLNGFFDILFWWMKS
jgi:hypothetical protein